MQFKYLDFIQEKMNKQSPKTMIIEIIVLMVIVFIFSMRGCMNYSDILSVQDKNIRQMDESFTQSVNNE